MLRHLTLYDLIPYCVTYEGHAPARGARAHGADGGRGPIYVCMYVYIYIYIYIYIHICITCVYNMCI